MNPVSLTKPFSELAAALLDKIELDKRESRHIVSLRDSLLPKLIFGEIGLHGVEDAAEVLT